MRGIKDILISPETPVIEALKRIDSGLAQIALVIDSDQKLIGTLTDGDVRRGILRGVALSAPVGEVMNRNSLSIDDRATEEAALALMRNRRIHQLPVIDSGRRVVGLVTLDQTLRATHADTTVVIMAGGVGSRLRPLTDATPKPLLPIGGRPLLEITISGLARQGFCRFLVSVNYKAEMFRNHFNKGSHLGVEIDYLEEDERLGTAGALRLLPERPQEPILVMNADILTNLDAHRLVLFHRDQDVCATMCVREYEWQVPYGVVQLENERLVGLEEKPVRREFVNAGVYVLSPEALDHVPPAGPLDMPTLFSTLQREIGPPAVYPLREYWLDIGQFDDLQRAQDDINLFK
jgi:dTDP-glucose pyrophosphorylase/predicted transcriptional regulator